MALLLNLLSSYLSQRSQVVLINRTLSDLKYTSCGVPLLNVNKKSYRTCACGDIETKIHLFFYCNFHDAARAILFNKVCNIVTDHKSPEFFDCLSNVGLLRIFLFGLPDNEPSHISVAVFCAVDDFLKSCNRF